MSNYSLNDLNLGTPGYIKKQQVDRMACPNTTDNSEMRPVVKNPRDVVLSEIVRDAGEENFVQAVVEEGSESSSRSTSPTPHLASQTENNSRTETKAIEPICSQPVPDEIELIDDLILFISNKISCNVKTAEWINENYEKFDSIDEFFEQPEVAGLTNDQKDSLRLQLSPQVQSQIAEVVGSNADLCKWIAESLDSTDDITAIVQNEKCRELSEEQRTKLWSHLNEIKKAKHRERMDQLCRKHGFNLSSKTLDYIITLHDRNLDEFCQTLVDVEELKWNERMAMISFFFPDDSNSETQKLLLSKSQQFIDLKQECEQIMDRLKIKQDGRAWIESNLINCEDEDHFEQCEDLTPRQKKALKENLQGPVRKLIEAKNSVNSFVEEKSEPQKETELLQRFGSYLHSINVSLSEKLVKHLINIPSVDLANHARLLHEERQLTNEQKLLVLKFFGSKQKDAKMIHALVESSEEYANLRTKFRETAKTMGLDTEAQKWCDDHFKFFESADGFEGCEDLTAKETNYLKETLLPDLEALVQMRNSLRSSNLGTVSDRQGATNPVALVQMSDTSKDSCDGLPSSSLRIQAGHQKAFNKALNALTKEKNSEILSLRAQLKQLKETLKKAEQNQKVPKDHNQYQNASCQVSEDFAEQMAKDESNVPPSDLNDALNFAFNDNDPNPPYTDNRDSSAADEKLLGFMFKNDQQSATRDDEPNSETSSKKVDSFLDTPSPDNTQSVKTKKHSATYEIQPSNDSPKRSVASVDLSTQIKIAVNDFKRNDLVLVLYDEFSTQYRIFSVTNTPYFLHYESSSEINLSKITEKGNLKYVAVFISKELCQVKKSANRFNLEVGQKFYRVRAKLWKP